jgi:outer membrane scaffolding protein for murein synthesis (MipA/OmpV family)
MRICALAIAGMIAAIPAANAEDTAGRSNAGENDRPLWEVGIGGGGGYVPDYPAAGENHVKALALPYLIYRGEFLRAGDKGIVRGRLLKTDRIDFDVSFDGSFSADSDDNDARQGMPDLDYLGEIGPRLQITLARAARDAKIDLELPLRAVFSSDFSEVKFRGVVFHPELAYQHANFLDTGVGLKLGIGPIFATEDLMDYFYEVSPTYATAARPVYDADGGYLGSQVGLRLTRPVGERIRLYGVFNAGIYPGATNEDSPLFREDYTYSAGIGMAWSFFQSEARGAR